MPTWNGTFLWNPALSVVYQIFISVLQLMDWVLCNNNSRAKRVLLACNNIHVKILHLFQQDVPFLV